MWRLFLVITACIATMACSGPKSDGTLNYQEKFMRVGDNMFSMYTISGFDSDQKLRQEGGGITIFPYKLGYVQGQGYPYYLLSGYDPRGTSRWSWIRICGYYPLSDGAPGHCSTIKPDAEGGWTFVPGNADAGKMRLPSHTKIKEWVGWLDHAAATLQSATLKNQ